jgi:hypothetical protein
VLVRGAFPFGLQQNTMARPFRDDTIWRGRGRRCDHDNNRCVCQKLGHFLTPLSSLRAEVQTGAAPYRIHIAALSVAIGRQQQMPRLIRLIIKMILYYISNYRCVRLELD